MDACKLIMHIQYLEEDLEGDDLLVAFPHLVQDADTHRGGSNGQQHRQKVRGHSLAAAHSVVSSSMLACFHLLCACTLLWAPFAGSCDAVYCRMGQMLWQQLEETGVSFSVASVLEREVSLLRNGVTRH